MHITHVSSRVTDTHGSEPLRAPAPLPCSDELPFSSVPDDELSREQERGDVPIENPRPNPDPPTEDDHPGREAPVSPPVAAPETAAPELDDFKIEYHPSSGSVARIYSFNEFQRHRPTVPSPAELLEHLSKPWQPFSCREDYEFAEVVLEAGMSQQQITRLLQVVKRIQSGESQFSFATHQDVTNAWQRAAQFHARVQ